MAAPNSTRGPTAGVHERWCWILAALVGQQVTATLKDGATVTGILAAATPDAADLSVAIRQAVVLAAQPSAAAAAGTPAPKPSLVINGRDLVQLEATDAHIDWSGTASVGQAASQTQTAGGSASTSSSRERDSFRTDTDISRAAHLGKERQLQAWGAGDALENGARGGGIEDDGLAGGLEDSTSRANGFAKGKRAQGGGSGGGGGWDQFAANERAFGLRTDYDDELYTTRLDRSSSDFKQREARAAQLEREILKGSTSSSLAQNAHLAEERGEQMPDLNDEEERYGAVIRSPTEGAYVPPGARKAALARLQSQQQNGAASSGSASPAQPGAATPASSAASGGAARATAGAPATDTAAPAATTSLEPAAKSVTAEGKSTATSPSSKPNPNAKPYDRSMQEFVTSERVRLEQRRAQMQQAQQNAQQSQQQAQLKKEHDSKLASLLQWSQTFKNPYPMPDEVAQILGKKPTAAAAAAEGNKADGDKKVAASGTASAVSPPGATKAVPSTAANGSTSKPAPKPAAGKITKAMVLEIPPFDPNRAKAKQAQLAAQKAGATSPGAAGVSPTAGAAAAAAGSPAEGKSPLSPPASASSKKLSATSAAFVFKPNPAAASFTPGASTGRRPSAASTASGSAATGAGAAAAGGAPASAAEASPKVPANPFFGTKQIKKGSSSMHVKEDFTPFKNGTLPEPWTVTPAWSFTGKPYRSIFPYPPQAPMLEDAAGAAGGMMDPTNAAAIAAAQQQQQQQAQAQAQAVHAQAFAAGMPVHMMGGPPPPPPVMAMSASSAISGSPASLPPSLPPMHGPHAGAGGGQMHPQQQQQQQPPQQQHHHYPSQQFGAYAQHPQAAFNPAAMGFAMRPGSMPPPQQQPQPQHMNAPGPGPQFQPHHSGGPPHQQQHPQQQQHLQQHPQHHPGQQQQAPPYMMQGFVPGVAHGPPPPHGAQMLTSPHMAQSAAAAHSPRVAGRGGPPPPQQQQQGHMPWTPPPPPQFVQQQQGAPNGPPHPQGPGGYPQQQQ